MGTLKIIELIEKIAKLGYVVGLGLAVLYIILIGFKYIKGGSKDTSEARHELILILIGVIIIILSFAIPTIIRSFIET